MTEEQQVPTNLEEFLRTWSRLSPPFPCESSTSTTKPDWRSNQLDQNGKTPM